MPRGIHFLVKNVCPKNGKKPTKSLRIQLKTWR